LPNFQWSFPWLGLLLLQQTATVQAETAKQATAKAQISARILSPVSLSLSADSGDTYSHTLRVIAPDNHHFRLQIPGNIILSDSLGNMPLKQVFLARNHRQVPLLSEKRTGQTEIILYLE